MTDNRKTNITVGIVDDHPLAINGLSTMLSTTQHLKVISSYYTGTDLLRGLEAEQPNVLLLDIQLPDIKGSELADMVHKSYPSIGILAITSLDAPVHIKTMMRNGCKGYLLKNTDVKTLVEAIETVHAGNEYIETSLKEQLMQNMLQFRKQEKTSPKLTRREREILEHIVQGDTNQQIANKLFLSLRTIENHRFSLLQKLDVKNTAILVKTAIELGLIK